MIVDIQQQRIWMHEVASPEGYKLVQMYQGDDGVPLLSEDACVQVRELFG